MKNIEIKEENICAMALVDKMNDVVEFVQAYSECYIAQLVAINKLIEHKDDKDKLYRAYVIDSDMYCKHSYCFYDNEIMSLPGGFLEETLSQNITHFLMDKAIKELRSILFNDED